MTHWTVSASGPALVLLGLAWVAAAGFGWVHWRRRRGAAVAAMEGLRLVVVTLLLITLLKPERVRRLVVSERPEIAVLHDASGSMATRDVVGPSNEVMPRSEWLRRTLATQFWKPLEAKAEVIVESFARPDAPAGPDAPPPGAQGTDIHAALERVMERQKHLKAVLLLSDGDWTAGPNPMLAAARLRARQTPLFTVAIGSETPLPDLILEPVAAPSYGLLGEQISIPFRVRSHLPREVRTAVTLAGLSGLVARKDVIIPPHGQVEDSLVWLPRVVGDYPLTMSLPPQEGEYLQDNNERAFRVNVRTEKIHVLVVDSQPRWEYRYLRNALERDPGVEVDCLLYHPGMPVGQGTNYLGAFPSTREAISKYDVLFLGDVGLGPELAANDLAMIRGMVEEQASGLVFLPGRRGRQLDFANSPIEELMPVVPDRQKPSGYAAPGESRLSLTTGGQNHFLTRLSNEEGRNAAIWKGLPGFFWCAAVERAKPGAEVLAVHPALRNAQGRLPLLVVRPFGHGEVLFMGTDSAWRWRRGVEDKYHYRFWGQVVRWMAHKRHMAQGEGLRLTYTPENPQAGERVYFQATPLDLVGITGEERLQARIQAPSGKTERLELAPSPGGWGVFQGVFPPQEGGTYTFEITGARGLKLQTSIQVSAPQVEKIGQPANPVLLRELAQLTRGASGGTGALHAMVQTISLLPEPEPAELRFRLWANPWWGGLIVLLLAIYWTARKAAGMI